MKKTVEIVLMDNEEEYKKEFLRIYCGTEKYDLNGITVIFLPENFDHIFSEPIKGDLGQRSFSERRARKLMFIKALLDPSFPLEVLYEPSQSSVAIFCVALECVMYLHPRPSTETLQVKTFFDFGKDHTKMYQKQKNKCIPLKLEDLFK